MSMDVHERVAATRRRMVQRAAGVLAVVLVVLVVGAVMTRALGGDDPTPTAAPAAAGDPARTAPISPAVPPTGSTTGAGGSQQGVFVPPERRVVLPTGAEQIDEYPVRFPHTPEGAASLVVAVTRYSGTLDYAIADEVVRLYADPSIAQKAADQAAAGGRALRVRMGLPTTGPVPPEYALIARPIGVQWKQVSDDVYDVSILFTLDQVTKDGTTTELVRSTNRVRWVKDRGTNGGDWKAIAPTGELAPKGGELGTKAFNDGGYAAIAEER